MKTSLNKHKRSAAGLLIAVAAFAAALTGCQKDFEMDLPLAVMVAIPEPWSHNDTISQRRRDFYQYYATMMEPWDGPAAILFSKVTATTKSSSPTRPTTVFRAKSGSSSRKANWPTP